MMTTTTTTAERINALTNPYTLHRETAHEVLLFADSPHGMPLSMLLSAWGAARIGVPLTVLLAHRAVNVTDGIVTVTNPVADLNELVFASGNGSG
ncbi:hypothetical protein [Mycolicibacterium fallax]|uniref:Uncharacterized protein n=1 Tax=Mycolicibacterium fallax TaxID=1793 RepID=A0A1X1R7W1_MYCFA|nr:hypothetical protein [Mycolicibacterium fallax]ORV00970.1 hypothetical protein AWC04_14960 [Mycolicibacterium fallax]BBZ00525.1 hypothetical protein MFAL_39910 [Mycolicibacterium fallax]